MKYKNFVILIVEGDKMERKNAWKKYDDNDLNRLHSLCEDYKKFLDTAKTEREAATEIIRRAKEKGYVDLEDYIKEGKSIKSGDKIYVNNKGKAVEPNHLQKE